MEFHRLSGATPAAIALIIISVCFLAAVPAASAHDPGDVKTTTSLLPSGVKSTEVWLGDFTLRRFIADFDATPPRNPFRDMLVETYGDIHRELGDHPTLDGEDFDFSEPWWEEITFTDLYVTVLVPDESPLPSASHLILVGSEKSSLSAEYYVREYGVTAVILDAGQTFRENEQSEVTVGVYLFGQQESAYWAMLLGEGAHSSGCVCDCEAGECGSAYWKCNIPHWDGTYDSQCTGTQPDAEEDWWFTLTGLYRGARLYESALEAANIYLCSGTCEDPEDWWEDEIADHGVYLRGGDGQSALWAGSLDHIDFWFLYKANVLDLASKDGTFAARVRDEFYDDPPDFDDADPEATCNEIGFYHSGSWGGTEFLSFFDPVSYLDEFRDKVLMVNNLGTHDHHFPLNSSNEFFFKEEGLMGSNGDERRWRFAMQPNEDHRDLSCPESINYALGDFVKFLAKNAEVDAQTGEAEIPDDADNWPYFRNGSLSVSLSQDEKEFIVTCDVYHTDPTVLLDEEVYLWYANAPSRSRGDHSTLKDCDCGNDLSADPDTVCLKKYEMDYVTSGTDADGLLYRRYEVEDNVPVDNEGGDDAYDDEEHYPIFFVRSNQPQSWYSSTESKSGMEMFQATPVTGNGYPTRERWQTIIKKQNDDEENRMPQRIRPAFGDIDDDGETELILNVTVPTQHRLRVYDYETSPSQCTTNELIWTEMTGGYPENLGEWGIGVFPTPYFFAGHLGGASGDDPRDGVLLVGNLAGSVNYLYYDSNTQPANDPWQKIPVKWEDPENEDEWLGLNTLGANSAPAVSCLNPETGENNDCDSEDSKYFYVGFEDGSFYAAEILGVTDDGSGGDLLEIDVPTQWDFYKPHDYVAEGELSQPPFLCTPSFFDIDGDSDDELIVGDAAGITWFYESEEIPYSGCPPCPPAKRRWIKSGGLGDFEGRSSPVFVAPVANESDFVCDEGLMWLFVGFQFDNDLSGSSIPFFYNNSEFDPAFDCVCGPFSGIRQPLTYGAFVRTFNLEWGDEIFPAGCSYYSLDPQDTNPWKLPSATCMDPCP